MLQYLGAEESVTYRGVEQLVARRAHNPEVVGSSPASATIKIPGIHYEYRGFSNFLAQNENMPKSILGHFWVTCPKNCRFWVNAMPFYGSAHQQYIPLPLPCFPL